MVDASVTVKDLLYHTVVSYFETWWFKTHVLTGCSAPSNNNSLFLNDPVHVLPLCRNKMPLQKHGHSAASVCPLILKDTLTVSIV